jgi:hypothetical protein
MFIVSIIFLILFVSLFVVFTSSKGDSLGRRGFTTTSTTICCGHKSVKCAVLILDFLDESEMNEDGINYYLGDNITEDGKEALRQGCRNTYYVNDVKVVLTPY